MNTYTIEVKVSNLFEYTVTGNTESEARAMLEHAIAQQAPGSKLEIMGIQEENTPLILKRRRTL